MPRWAVTPGQLRGRAYHRRLRKAEGDALYHAEVRAYIARRLREGAGIPTIARELRLPKRDVEEYMEQSIVRLREAGPERRQPGERDAEDQLPRYRRFVRGAGPGPHVKGSPKAPPEPEIVNGEILDPPDEAEFRRRAFELRKRALPFDEIAELLGRPEHECRAAVRARLKQLEADELADTSLARRMMLEQIDAMIAAITVPATGRDIDGRPARVVLEAIDRMVKLLDQKAKLLGLNAPQKVDISIRLRTLAEETGYDYEELQDIAAEVLQSYSLRSLK